MYHLYETKCKLMLIGTYPKTIATVILQWNPSIHCPQNSEFIKNRRKSANIFLQIFFSPVKLTVVSASGRFLKTKYYQNHEQDTRPEEFSKRKDLGRLLGKMSA